MKSQVQTFPTLPELLAATTTKTLEILQSAIDRHGIATIALSGGSTPKPLYQAIAKAHLDWSKLHIFWGDERYVSSDHPDSNENMARQAWLNQVPIPPENIHPVPTQFQSPIDSVQDYEKTLHQIFKTTPGEFPTFDCILLGMGDDGHTASLFPHTAALDVHDRLITLGEKSGQPRITFTYPLINQADHVIFLVAGASKQTALRAIFSPEADAKLYPARAISPRGNLWWMMDYAASEGILGMEGVPEL